MQESMNWRAGDIVKPKSAPGSMPYRLIRVWFQDGKWQGNFEPADYPGTYVATSNDLDVAFMKLVQQKASN